MYVTLSRRNLLTLLHMLDDPDSSKLLHKPTPNGTVLVSPVADEKAYRNRAPGRMGPEREEFIRLAEKALKEVHAGMATNQDPPASVNQMIEAVAKPLAAEILREMLGFRSVPNMLKGRPLNLRVERPAQRNAMAWHGDHACGDPEDRTAFVKPDPCRGCIPTGDDCKNCKR